MKTRHAARKLSGPFSKQHRCSARPKGRSLHVENLELRTLLTVGGNEPLFDPAIVTANAPGVLNVTSTNADGVYVLGSDIEIEVTFDDDVMVTGMPRLLLETGDTDRYAIYDAAESSGSTLVFDYTVQPGDSSSDLDYTSSMALELNGGTIRDGDDEDADLTLPVPSTAGSLGANQAMTIVGEMEGEIFAQANVPGDWDSGFYSYDDSIYADDFTVSGTSLLTAVRVYGGYSSAVTDNWVFEISRSEYRRPGTVIPATVTSVNQVDTGHDLLGTDVYQITFELEDLYLDPGTYWVRVSNDVGSAEWFWVHDDLEENTSRHNPSPIPWETLPEDFALEVVGYEGPDILSPEVLTVEPNFDPITENDAASGPFTLAVRFNEPMDTSGSYDPVISFPMPSEGLGNVLTFLGGYWSDSSTYVASYVSAHQDHS